MLKKSHRKWLRITGIVVAVIIVLFVGLHIWFSYNARHILENEVHTKSKGMLTLRVRHFSFNYLTRHIVIKTAYLQSNDTVTQNATYKVQFGKLDIRINSFWPLFFKRQLYIDSIKLFNPQFAIYRWRADSSRKDDVSVPREMGKLYNSMLDALNTFGIQRVFISNGKFILVNKINRGSQPVVISNIYFNLIRKGDDVQTTEYVAKEQQIDLTTFNQHITLPDGRHQLSFKNFKLELFKKRIELDSCTISAEATDSARSRYTVFFTKLMLVNVDFDAMYRYNLIKADSVYCLQPRFQIQLATYKKENEKDTSSGPDPQKLLQELTGNLQIGFVGVENAGIHINITGAKDRTFYNSNQDDFEVRGLLVNADSSTPVSVKRFDMLVQDYHLYNKDSSSSFSFDSIHVLDNKITLSNFIVNTSSSPDKIRSVRDFKIPSFQLIGLDWYDLVFDQNLNANEAVLYNPVIYYKAKPKTDSRKKTNIFQVLQIMDSLMTLRKIGLINGQINMILSPTTSFQLQNASVVLNSNDLLESKTATGIKESVEMLQFSKGVIHIKDVTAKLDDVDYTGKNLMHAASLSVYNNDRTLKAAANNVWLENLLLDEASATVQLQGIRWGNAQIAIKGVSAKNKDVNKGAANLSIKHIAGSNTDFTLINDSTRVHTYINSITASQLSKDKHQPIEVKDLNINGKQLLFTNGPLTAQVDAYAIHDNANSKLSNVQVVKQALNDSLEITVPQVTFTADVNSILQNNLYLPAVYLEKPHVVLAKTATGDNPAQPAPALNVKIDSFVATEPYVQVRLTRNDSVFRIAMPQSKSNYLSLRGLQSVKNGLTIGSLHVAGEAITYTKPTGEVLGIPEGKIDTRISNIHFSTTNKAPEWSAMVNSFDIENPQSLTIGKNRSKLNISAASLGNLQLSSATISDITKLARSNLAIWLRTKNGSFTDSITTFKWVNSSYNAAKQHVTIDSFIYHPTKSLDTAMAHAPYQFDYITLATGQINISDFDLEKYSRDSAMKAGTLAITHPVITIYRDKRLPYKEGAIKPLPTAVIKNIDFPILVKKITLRQGALSYTEVNEKTGAKGTVDLTDLKATISHIKNKNLDDNDSLKLSMDAFLLDSAKIRLRVHESYLDTLNTFRMTLRMTPTSLTFLNSVLVPLSNVKIVSGKIDSLQLRALAQEYLALGEMAMYYHNLKIQLVKDGNPHKTTLITKVISFLANTFIIKKNNNGHKGLVYFERLRNRSFFNYIIKITFSGMATNIGAKSNRKYMRKYHKKLDKEQLPPIDFDTDME